MRIRMSGRGWPRPIDGEKLERISKEGSEGIDGFD